MHIARYITPKLRALLIDNQIINTCTDFMRSPHGFFIVVALLFGLPLLLLRPAYDVPDFGAHLSRAYDISQGKFIPQPLDSKLVFNSQVGFAIPSSGYKQVGGYLPRDVALLTDTFTPKYPWARHQIAAIDQFGLYTQKRDLTKVPVQYNTVAVYNPLSYVPQALGLLASRVMGVSIYGGVLLASCINFLLWLLATYKAIKVAPLGKWLFVVVNLLPMTLFLAPSLSPDPLLMGAANLFVAYLLKILYEASSGRSPARADTAVLVVCSVALALFKQTYFLLPFAALALLFTPLEKKQTLKTVIACTALPLFATLVWALIQQHQSFLIAPWSDPKHQLPYSLFHPLHVIAAFLRTAIYHSNDVVWSFFGSLGWLTIKIPLISIIALAFAMGVAILIDGQAQRLTIVQRMIIAGVGLANLLLILATLYIYWTPYKGTVIEGLQGRYFLPLAIVLPVLFPRHRGVVLNPSKGRLYICLALVGGLAAAWGLLAASYYPSII